MISDHRCFFCFTRAFEKLLEKESISDEAKSSFTLDMISLYQNKRGDFSSPLFSRELHHILRSYTHNDDPYKEAKKKHNDQSLSMLPELRKIIQQSGDHFATALRLSIAGNIIDFAASDNFDLQVTIDKALVSDFAIDHSEQLRDKIERAKNILYLGDNAGEIVFDKLLIRSINHPDVTFAARGGPVINDATTEDAEYVGMKEVANVISNGFDAPSTIPDKCSPEFQKYFKEADLIISKGQGNLEGLFPLNDDRIFFLLMVKCDVIAEFLKVRKGSFVVFNPRLN
jgi:damage-control phosphatase, subfamily I